MPVISDEDFQQSRQAAPAVALPPEVKIRPTASAAFKMGMEDSVIGSTARWLADKWDPTPEREDPNFDPFDGLENTPYAEYASSFVGARNRTDFERIRTRIDQENERREAMQDVEFFSGANFANMAGSILGDPTVFIPGGAAAEGLSVGRTIASTGLRSAGAGLVAGSVAEGILQGTQETRTAGESAVNIGAATIFGGLLGAGASALGAGGKAAVSRVGSRASALEKTLDVYSSGSMGAAQTGGGGPLSGEGLKSAFGLDKLLTPTSPLLRAAASPSGETRRAMARLSEDALIRNKNTTGVASDVAVTRRVEMWRTGLADALVGLDDSFLKYRLPDGGGKLASAGIAVGDLTGRTQGKLTRSQFAEEVGRALIRGDTHDIPEVARAAELVRKTVFDPLKEAAIEEGLLPDGVKSQVAESYLTRLYNRDMIAARRQAWRDGEGELQPGFEDKIVRWLEGRQQSFMEEMEVAQSSVRAARAALEKHLKLADEVEGIADSPDFGKVKTKAEKKLEQAEGYRDEIRGIADASPEELKGIASDITDRVLSHEDRGMVFRPVAVKRGPLKQLTLTIPTVEIEEFLEKDAERVARVYHRVMSTDVELTRSFGSPDMEEAFQKIRDDYAKLRDGVEDQGKLTKLNKSMERDLRDLAAVRDRIRGTYAMPDNPQGILSRTVRTTKSINYMRMLGGMVLSAIPDTMRPVFVHGPMRVMRDGLLPMITNAKGYKLASKEAKLAGAALEIVLDGRAARLADVTEEFGHGNRFERGVEAATEKFGLLTMMTPWDNAMKSFSGVVTQTRTLEAAAKWASGNLPKKEVERLAHLGIDENMAVRIDQQFRKFGEDQGTLKWANTQAWDDKEAAGHYRAALGKEIDKIIVTPSQEKPLWMSSQLGQILGQFQSFQVASMQRVLLAGLQQRDAAALSGFVGMAGMGMLVYWLRTYLTYGLDEGGEHLSDDPEQWLLEGIDRGGALGYAFTFDRALDIASRGQFSVRAAVGGEELSRFKQRQGVVGLLGPTVAGMQDMAIVSGAALSGDVSESDIKAARRLIPGQNLFYWRWLFDQAEDGLSDAVR